MKDLKMPNENKRLRIDIIFTEKHRDKDGNLTDKVTCYPEAYETSEGCIAVEFEDAVYAYPLHTIKRIKETHETIAPN